MTGAARALRVPRTVNANAAAVLRLLRDASRLVVSRFTALTDRLFSFQHRLEAAFLASGAAAQLADAALEGESTAHLATRIARIARTLAGAEGAAVHLRGGGGLVALGADGAACELPLAKGAFERGIIVRGGHAAALPLRVRDTVVGALSLRFRGAPGDLRPLQPLLSRAGAVLAAAEREARKDRFLSLAAHELKTPLTSIKGFSYSLARRLERGQPCDPKHVEVLERQAEKLHGLLEEMLEVSRLETGRFVLHQEPCELLELIDSSRRALRRLAVDTPQLQADGPLPLLADRERLERAISAMVMRARALGSPVKIVARPIGRTAEVRVAWTGAPLDGAGRERAFEPRWEAPQADRQGLGMALLVAREAAELHGGSLEAEANALVLRLPLRAGAAETPASAGHARVLVVDDDEPMARMMAEFLSEHGLDARCAAGGREALEKTVALRPDLLVLDLRMPELDGRALLHALWTRGLHPRVVLLSADRDVAAAARELSCEGFVEKPFAPENLLAAVRRALPAVPGAAK